MADIHAKLQEEKILRSIRAKRRFRAAVRHVIHNISWLQDDDEDIIDPDNVKQTVTRLARKRKTGKGLSIREKAVLRKNIIYRTEDEKKLLNKYIGGLKCFRRYPENVQLELVGVTYFEYYGQGRVLVRQNDEAHAMYFLLSGEVQITRTQWDEIAKQNVEVELGRVHAGSMFGEVSLLHNVTRTATVNTVAPCELLVLKKEDFDRVLKASLMQRWDDIREAMTKFMYFDNWDSVAIRECCILSKMKSYAPNQVVFGDGKIKKGAPAMIHFLIEGRCVIVEHLFVEETVKKGIKCYKLYDTDNLDVGLQTNDEEEFFDRPKSCDEMRNDVFSTKSEKIEEPPEIGESIKEYIRQSVKSLNDIKSPKGDETQIPLSMERKRTEKMSIMTYKTLLRKELQRLSENRYQSQRTRLPPNVKLRFMQICTLEAKSTFLEGELMQNRRVIALTPVRFLLIPAYWLIQHNRGNVWTRVEHFLRNRIPTRQEVFKAYVSNKKWQEYKKNLRDDILSKRKFYNNTTIHDVPYSIRIVSNYE